MENSGYNIPVSNISLVQSVLTDKWYLSFCSFLEKRHLLIQFYRRLDLTWPSKSQHTKNSSERQEALKSSRTTITLNKQSKLQISSFPGRQTWSPYNRIKKQTVKSLRSGQPDRYNSCPRENIWGWDHCSWQEERSRGTAGHKAAGSEKRPVSPNAKQKGIKRSKSIVEERSLPFLKEPEWEWIIIIQTEKVTKEDKKSTCLRPGL